MATIQQFRNFDEQLVNSHLPMLVVFYAPWCGPSRLMNAILQQVSDRLQGRLQVLKIDSETESALASKYDVHPLPTLLLFRQGQLIARIEEERVEDLLPAEHLIQRLETWV